MVFRRAEDTFAQLKTTRLKRRWSSSDAILLKTVLDISVIIFFYAAVSVYRLGRQLTFYVDADITFINSKNLTGIGKIEFGRGKCH